MHSIFSNSFGSSFHTEHLHAPPLGHVTGAVPMTKNQWRWYP
jgi:hypothetical protein